MTPAATASATASTIQPHGVLVSDEAGSAATVSVGLVPVLVSGGLVVSPRAAAMASASQPKSPLSSDGSVSVGTVLVVAGAASVSLAVVVGCAFVGSEGVVGASAVVPGGVSVRAGRVGKVRLGSEPVGTSAPDKPVRPLKPPPPQPARR
jgi:hypothetical protein